MLAALEALSHIQRLRILAMLERERIHVSELARRLDISRPLVIMHLKRLEAAGLIVGSVELSEDSKAMKFYIPTQFDIRLTPASIANAMLAGPADAADGHTHEAVGTPAEEDGSE